MLKESENNTDLEVLDFLSEFCSVQRNQVTLDSDIVADLHIEGDDASELIEVFSQKFGIDMSGFELDKYFVSEFAFNPFAAVLSVFTGKSREQEKIYVKDLIRAAKAKKWVEENQDGE